jgi:spermidine synthase
VREGDDVVTIGRAETPRGEVVLRRRGSGAEAVEELVVNGAFAMDSTETHSERELGRIAAGAPRVLVGGLGLGHTVAAVLDEADRLRLPVTRVAADPRVRLHVGDVATVLAAPGDGPTGPWDAILLDVDNGPDFLIHAANDALYAEPALRSAYARLAPGGVLAIWCQAPSPPLLAALRRVDGSAEEALHTVEREGRTFTYAIETVRRPLRPAPRGGEAG